MAKKNDESRRNFLKKLPFSIGSTVALAGLVFHEINSHNKPRVKSISKKEANELVKTMNSNIDGKLSPKPAPNKNA